jgi:small subunit ribosomal protein S5
MEETNTTNVGLNPNLSSSEKGASAPQRAGGFAPRKFGQGGRRPFVKREGGEGQGDNRGPRRGGGGRGRGGQGGKFEKPKAEFESKAIDVRRVTRVVSGGRRFSYSVATVVGDRKGHVGFGIGKSIDTSMAMDKAYRAAVKKMITLRLNKNFSIPYETKAKFNASKISLMPNKGRGLIAGSSARKSVPGTGARFPGVSTRRLATRCSLSSSTP